MALEGAPLPVRKLNQPVVLPAHAVLRKQTRQLLGVDPHFPCIFVVLRLQARAVVRKHLLHCRGALGNDPWVAAVEYHPQPVHAASVSGKASITEVQTKQVCVGRRQLLELVDGSATCRA
jgi:hypothetical protein